MQTRDERLEDGGAVDILYPHICIVSAYRVPPPSEGPLGFVPGFFTRGVGFFIQAYWTAGGSWFVWSRVGDFSQPTNQPARPTSSQVRVTSTVWSTAIEGHSQCPSSELRPTIMTTCHDFFTMPSHIVWQQKTRFSRRYGKLHCIVTQFIRVC